VVSDIGGNLRGGGLGLTVVCVGRGKYRVLCVLGYLFGLYQVG